MLSLVFFLTFGGVLWLYSTNTYLSRDILRFYSFLMLIVSFMAYGVSVIVVKNDEKPTSFYLAFIPIFLLSLWFIKKKIKTRGLNIVANQQRYWDEVTSDDVANFFKERKKVKTNRVAVDVNVNEKKFFKKLEVEADSGLPQYKNYISPSFFKNLKRLETDLTYVKNLDEIKEYSLYNIIFEKLKKIIKLAEKKVDFEKILEENDFCLEFFLLFVWENYTGRTNISNANLIVLVQRDVEEELVGALDNLDLNCVKKRGAALYYKYMVYHNKDLAYVSKDEENSVAQDDEVSSENMERI